MRDYTFSDLDLHDGVEYFVVLIVCNGAGLCANATSKALLVDSTPPNRGKIQIEHHPKNTVLISNQTLCKIFENSMLRITDELQN